MGSLAAAIDWMEAFAKPTAQRVFGDAAVPAEDRNAALLAIPFDNDASDLAKVVRLARTVRNNLFHGGKHGNEGWDNLDRMRQLLPTTIIVLDELAALSGISSDYRREY